MDAWALSGALLGGTLLFALVAVRIAAAVPAVDPGSGAGPKPQLPGWLARTWLIVPLLAMLTLVSYIAAPSLCEVVLAGPFAGVTHFADIAATTWIGGGVLCLMIIAHPIRPGVVTMLVTVAGVVVWVLSGLVCVVASC